MNPTKRANILLPSQYEWLLLLYQLQCLLGEPGSRQNPLCDQTTGNHKGCTRQASCLLHTSLGALQSPGGAAGKDWIVKTFLVILPHTRCCCEELCRWNSSHESADLKIGRGAWITQVGSMYSHAMLKAEEECRRNWRIAKKVKAEGYDRGGNQISSVRRVQCAAAVSQM